MKFFIGLACLLTIACVAHCQDDHGDHGDSHEVTADGHTHEPNCMIYLDCVRAGTCTVDQHGVCDPVDKYCHCHDYGEIECDNDQICIDKCPDPGEHCCHNDHHCHCNEPCGQNYTKPLTPTTSPLTTANNG
ncbi:hypothetical protein Btru_026394 [Bulinus truncatus]|nr:hypothetical protein Btru_026394 [Bulinus truncatus]